MAFAFSIVAVPAQQDPEELVRIIHSQLPSPPKPKTTSVGAHTRLFFSVLADPNSFCFLWPSLMHFFWNGTAQAIATEFISNVAASRTHNIMQLLDMGVLPTLVELMDWLVMQLGSEPYPTKQFQAPTSLRMALDSAVWALGNIAGDSPTTREIVNRSTAPVAILKAFSAKGPCATSGLLQTSLWALANMARGSFPNKLLPAADLALGAINSFKDSSIVTDALFLLSQLSGGEDYNQSYVASVPGLVEKVLELLVVENVVSETALRVIGNLLAGDAHVTNLVVDMGAIEPLIPLLKHQKRTIRKATVWAFSNILADSRPRICFCVEQGVIADLMDEIVNGGAADVANEAYWCLTNCLVDAPPEELKRICLDPHFLQCYAEAIVHQNENLSRHALSCIEKVLGFGCEVGTILRRSTEAFYDEKVNPFVEYLYAHTADAIEAYVDEGSGHPSEALIPELDDWIPEHQS